MSRKKRRNRGQLEAVDTCRASIKSVKQRYKDAKEDLQSIMDLVDNGAIQYNSVDEVVGSAYLKLYAAKQELKARRREK